MDTTDYLTIRSRSRLSRALCSALYVGKWVFVQLWRARIFFVQETRTRKYFQLSKLRSGCSFERIQGAANVWTPMLYIPLTRKSTLNCTAEKLWHCISGHVCTLCVHGMSTHKPANNSTHSVRAVHVCQSKFVVVFIWHVLRPLWECPEDMLYENNVTGRTTRGSKDLWVLLNLACNAFSRGQFIHCQWAEVGTNVKLHVNEVHVLTCLKSELWYHLSYNDRLCSYDQADVLI